MKEKKQNKKSCCSTKKKEASGFWQGLAYGLIPHTGCIAFIIGSVLGVTFLMEFFRPLLMNKYFFPALIALSLILAAISSIFYLRRYGMLSMHGIKSKWKYLSVMFGSTIGINLLFFLVIFPMVANVAVTAQEQPLTDQNTLSKITLQVAIPCAGHSPLISSELKKLSGVKNINYQSPDTFIVSYNPDETSKQDILSLEIFKEYKATVLSESK